MKRVLMLSDSASMQDLNNRSNLNLLIELGCEIHIGCNFLSGNITSSERVFAFRDELTEAGITWHQINFTGIPDSAKKEPAATSEIEGILQEYDFDLIHCLSPSCLVCVGKLANKLHIPVFFTTYGFPFYKGASPLKWLKYYQSYKKASRYADVLICTNKEDFELTEKSFKAKHVYRIPGVGLDPYRFRAPTISRPQMRELMEIPQNAVMLISIGALTANKNHAVILKALSRLRMLELHYVICGTGPKTDALYQLTQRLHLEDRVHFAKYREDVTNLLHASDIFCMPSIREGIGRSALEAMEAGLPLVTSNVQGIRDFMEDGVTGFMFNPHDVNGFVAGIEALTEDKRLRQHIGEHNRYAVELFYREHAEHIMRKLYQVQLDLPHEEDEEAEEEKETASAGANT